MSDILYIGLPAYNEEKNIEEVVRAWYPVLQDKHPDSRIVIADAGSKDQTHEILLSLQNEFPQLEILENTAKEHGPKVIALYRHAIKRGADYIFQTDSDGQTNPDEFDAFWNMRSQYDCILGNRTSRGDGKDRAMVERVVCLLLLLYFQVRIPDANAPFRLMKREVLEKYINELEDTYALPNIILSAYFSKFNEKLNFVEISFKPRVQGENSINLKKIFKIGTDSLSDFSRFRKKMKTYPLR